MKEFSCFTAGVILGGAAGAIAALMLSPKTGEENRQIVAEYASNAASSAQQFGNQAASTIQGGFKNAQEFGGNIISNVKEAKDKAGAQFSEKNDELREKIDAARARITEQMKKNAEETSETLEIKDAE